MFIVCLLIIAGGIIASFFLWKKGNNDSYFAAETNVFIIIAIWIAIFIVMLALVAGEFLL